MTERELIYLDILCNSIILSVPQDYVIGRFLAELSQSGPAAWSATTGTGGQFDRNTKQQMYRLILEWHELFTFAGLEMIATLAGSFHGQHRHGGNQIRRTFVCLHVFFVLYGKRQVEQR